MVGVRRKKRQGKEIDEARGREDEEEEKEEKG